MSFQATSTQCSITKSEISPLIPTPSPQMNGDFPCPGDVDPENPPHPAYRPTDISLIQRTLLHFLPAELADAILDMAECWPYVDASRNAYPTALSALEAPDHHAQWCYLVSPSIPPFTRHGVQPLPTKVTMVKFYIKTYASLWNTASKGSTQGIDVWFEACILKADEKVEYQDNTHPNEWYAGRVERPKYLNTFITPSSPGEPQENPLDTRERWQVTSNTSSAGVEGWNEIVWRCDDPTVNEDGKSRSSFVNSLDVGDRIIVMARAMSPGWVDQICNAKVEIYYNLPSLKFW